MKYAQFNKEVWRKRAWWSLYYFLEGTGRWGCEDLQERLNRGPGGATLAAFLHLKERGHENVMGLSPQYASSGNAPRAVFTDQSPNSGYLALMSTVPGHSWPHYLSLIKMSYSAYESHTQLWRSTPLLRDIVLHNTPSDTL